MTFGILEIGAIVFGAGIVGAMIWMPKFREKKNNPEQRMAELEKLEQQAQNKEEKAVYDNKELEIRRRINKADDKSKTLSNFKRGRTSIMPKAIPFMVKLFDSVQKDLNKAKKPEGEWKIGLPEESIGMQIGGELNEQNKTKKKFNL